MNRYTSDMKLWLFDLAHGNLSDASILSGFIRYYVIPGCGTADVHRDIAFHTAYGVNGVSVAMDNLNRVLVSVALPDKNRLTPGQ